MNKKEIFYKALDAVDKRIEKYQKEMDMIKESMDANDIKTDYDEDNRGKLLGDFEQNAGYLDDARQMKETLSEINLDHYSEAVCFGSVVETDKNLYYVAVPIGELKMEDGSTVYAISTDAPVYQGLKGKRVGDSYTFNDKEYKIVALH
ncbi:transcription elongation factor [Salegentibacter sp. F188]|uniref:Transcription elongation factor n=1 Tax=Autumnicola patrickiae TaxID=3075591 RepID=A0ABU3E497_9FLAO|nr:transcription elongation factor [Salegentibacter sp. F188]MDT0690072.1 transcription elongation factor [Salegentibacter sp. F188]